MWNPLAPIKMHEKTKSVPFAHSCIFMNRNGAKSWVLVEMAAATANHEIRAKPGLRKMCVHLCHCSPDSQGIRDFIKKCYMELKKISVGLPIQIWECSAWQPKFWAHSAFSQENNVSERLQCWWDSRSPEEYAKWQSLKPFLWMESSNPTAWALLDWVQCGKMLFMMLLQ